MIEINSPERARRIAAELEQRKQRAKTYAKAMGTEASTDLEPKALKFDRNKYQREYMRRRREKEKT